MTPEDIASVLAEATRSTLQALAGIDLERRGPAIWPPEGATRVATIGIAGDVTGELVLTTGSGGSQAIARGMLGASAPVGDAEVADALGEVVNVLAGAVRKSLDARGLAYDLALPEVARDTTTLLAVAGEFVRGHALGAADVHVAVYFVTLPA